MPWVEGTQNLQDPNDMQNGGGNSQEGAGEEAQGYAHSEKRVRYGDFQDAQKCEMA